MTLAYAAPEAGVLVSNDPAQAMLAAQADGLLTYHGYVSGGRYEAEAGGRHWTMSAAEALLTVTRLQAFDRLSRSGAVLELAEIRDDGSYAIQTSGGLLVLPESEVIHWCGGYLAGSKGNGQPHAGVSTIDEIADLFEHPSRNDQCRMVILGLMYGGPERIKATALADMIGDLPEVEKPPVRKTVGGALGFGKPLSSTLAEQMIAAFGLRWSLSASDGVVKADGKPVGALPKMPGLERLRALVEASGRGWLRYRGVASPNEARWLIEYPVSVGKTEYVISAEALLPWLRGLGAFHGS